MDTGGRVIIRYCKILSRITSNGYIFLWNQQRSQAFYFGTFPYLCLMKRPGQFWVQDGYGFMYGQ